MLPSGHGVSFVQVVSFLNRKVFSPVGAVQYNMNQLSQSSHESSRAIASRGITGSLITCGHMIRLGVSGHVQSHAYITCESCDILGVEDQSAS